jgi:hypothetical protein
MKQIILLYISLCLLFLSCKKENKIPATPPVNTEQKYAVNVTAGSFSYEMKDFSNAKTKQDTLRDLIKHLYYFVHTRQGELVKIIRQEMSDPNFGTINDSLPSGDYYISMLGTVDTVDLIPITYDPIGFPISIAAFHLPGGDAFYKRDWIFVQRTSVNAILPLERVVGKLRVVLTDTIPYGVGQLQFLPTSNFVYDPGLPQQNFLGLPGGIDLVGGERTYLYKYWMDNIPTDSLIGRMNYSIDLFILATDTMHIGMWITYTLNDGSYKIKAIPDIPIAPGKTTVLTGKLFYLQGASAIIEHPEWSTDTTRVSF